MLVRVHCDIAQCIWRSLTGSLTFVLWGYVSGTRISVRMTSLTWITLNCLTMQHWVWSWAAHGPMQRLQEDGIPFCNHRTSTIMDLTGNSTRYMSLIIELCVHILRSLCWIYIQIILWPNPVRYDLYFSHYEPVIRVHAAEGDVYAVCIVWMFCSVSRLLNLCIVLLLLYPRHLLTHSGRINRHTNIMGLRFVTALVRRRRKSFAQVPTCKGFGFARSWSMDFRSCVSRFRGSIWTSAAGWSKGHVGRIQVFYWAWWIICNCESGKSGLTVASPGVRLLGHCQRDGFVEMSCIISVRYTIHKAGVQQVRRFPNTHFIALTTSPWDGGGNEI